MNTRRYKDPITGERRIDFTVKIVQRDKEFEPLAYYAFANVTAFPDQSYDDDYPSYPSIAIHDLGWSDGQRTIGYEEGWTHRWDDSAEGQMLGVGWSNPKNLKQALREEAELIANDIFHYEPWYVEAYPELADDFVSVAHHLRDAGENISLTRTEGGRYIVGDDDYTFPPDIAPAATRLMRAIQAIEQYDPADAARVLNSEYRRYGRMQTSESELGWRMPLGDWSFRAFLKCAASA